MTLKTPPWLHRSGLGAAVAVVLSACGGVDEPESSASAAENDERAQAAAAGTTTAASSSNPAVGSFQLVSTPPGGVAAKNGSSTCAVSADGSKVPFSIDATNLVAGDSKRVADLFLKDLATDSMIRVTTQNSGAQIAAGSNCLGTTMTPDGRVVAFNPGNAVFVDNTQTGLLTQPSPPAGTAPQVTGFFGGALSDDGSSIDFLTLPETTHLDA